MLSSTAETSDLFHIEHDGVNYRPVGLIPVNLGTLREGYSTFKLKFFCKTACQPVKNMRLGISFFTQNKKVDETDEVYGVNHGACDALFPVEIK